jgi:fused signal recognition particle receptor
MFKLFKEKLKGALSIFSKKVEEEAKVEEREVEEPKQKAEDKKKEIQKEEQKREEKREEEQRQEKKRKESEKQEEERKEAERKERQRKEEEKREEEQRREEEKKTREEEQRKEHLKKERREAEEREEKKRKEEQRKEELRGAKDKEAQDKIREKQEREQAEQERQEREKQRKDEEREEIARKERDREREEQEKKRREEQKQRAEESERVAREKKEEDRKKEEKITFKRKEVSSSEVHITYFVHGTTKDNEEKKASGHSQIGLSDLGKRQSKELKNQLHHDFDVIISSDLKRAIDSAKLTWPDKHIVTDKRLRECDYGELTGHKEQELSRFAQKHDLVTVSFPKGESYSDVEERIRLFLNDIYEKYRGKHVALVSHRNPQLAIEVLLLGKSWKQAEEDDWRGKEPKEWQPGWDYILTEEISKKEEPEKKKGFFSKIFRKKEEQKEEKKTEEKIPEKKEHIHKVKPAEIQREEEKPERIEERQIEEKPVEEEEPEKQEKKGFFKKFTETFTTIQISDKRFEEIFWDLEVVMLESNVAVEVIEKIKEDLRKELTSQKVSRKKVEDIILDTLKHSILDLFDVETFDLLKEAKKKKPFVIAFIGVNGSGKTTTLAKVAKLFQDNHLTCVIAAADTFRAAAIQQLEEHANRLGIKLIKQDYKSDPAAVAFDAIQHAKAKGIDVVLVDTAGRLHSNDNLMNELKKLIRVNTPDLKIFVGESITGNDCVEQARLFNEAVGIDGIILAKADVDEKGGAAVSVSFITQKPILFLGTGQEYGDLKKFDPKIILESLGLS